MKLKFEIKSDNSIVTLSNRMLADNSLISYKALPLRNQTQMAQTNVTKK